MGKEFLVPRLALGKVVGLAFGGLVVAVMLAMMFAILGRLLMGDQ
ncbi:MAG TPA: hypothetical protein VL128_16755 [Candidatus Eisenbacteria bacterium]|nr:hypothetical protein [Candidatus Eisenbacteria bacterium]